MSAQKLPRHIAIIMDGNGRWAAARGLPRTAGHKRGMQAVKRTVRAAADLDIKYLTLFGFSSENWGRPAEEMRVLKLVAVDEKSFSRVVAAMQAAGRALGLKRLAIRCQTRFTGAYRHLVGAGFNVQWTDLRMTLVGFDERPVEGAVVLSNWEI